LRFQADIYSEALPGPADVLLILEVADTSLAYDREVKLPLYATAGIPEVWIANLNEGTIEVYRQPHGDRYEQVTTHRRGAALTPVSLPAFSVRVEEILG
jgi:Uma2 family endonuclease